MEANKQNTDNSLLQELIDQIDSLKFQVKQLQTENTALRNEITKLSAENAALKSKIVKLEAENISLKEKLNKNSHNSSKPPSSDGLSKPAPKSQRRPSGKKQGGQPGHPGAGLSMRREPDSTVYHFAETCADCPRKEACLAAGKVETRTEIDIRLVTVLTAHKTVSCLCPERNNQELTGAFPEHIRSSQQYGPGLMALVATLSSRGAVSINRIQEILAGFCNLSISTGTLHNMIKSVGNRLTDVVEKIKQQLINSPIINCDETGLRIDGSLFWVHNASNGSYTYLTVNKKRGKEGIDAADVLPEYSGTAVHDFWKPYWSYDKVRHAVCNSHLIRELQGLWEMHPEQPWLKEMQDLLIEIKKAKDQAIEDGQTALLAESWQELSAKYDHIVREGIRQNPILERQPGKKGRSKLGKLRALADRFKEHKEEVLLFAVDFPVPFTNNLAERDVRMTKVKAKVAGCFRTLAGAETYLTIKSFIKTSAKHGISSYKALLTALSGQNAASELIFQAD